MHSADSFRLFLLLGLAMLAPRPANAERLAFELYALGFSVADSRMSFDLTPTTYRMELSYQTTGLAKWVAGDSLDQTVAGTFQHDQAVPVQFSSSGRLKGHDRMVTLVYRDGDPTTTAINPPNETEREIVPPERRDHTIDTLSATIDMLHLAARTGRCDLSVNTYDGRRLEVFEAHTAGEEELPPTNRSTFSGRALRCDYSSRPVAGLKLGDGRDDDARTRAGTIWLAPVTPGGPRLPVRGLVDVRFLGQATMYLTGVTP
jgi:Protein of unknown function (DUF3108)